LYDPAELAIDIRLSSLTPRLCALLLSAWPDAGRRVTDPDPSSARHPLITPVCAESYRPRS